jgi:FkbM family methyltransferase
MPINAISPARILDCLKLSEIMPLRYAMRLILKKWSRSETTRIRINGWANEVVIRPGTTDLPVLRKILVGKEYLAPVKIAPKRILDAGAYIGFSALFFNQCYPDAQIYAFEPDVENFRLLVQNTASTPQIHPVNAAIWGSSGPRGFDANIDEKWASRVTDSAGVNATFVNCTSFQDAIEMAGGDFDLMKFDIEGGEQDVFESVEPALIAKSKAVVIEFHDRFLPGSSAPFRNLMRSVKHEVVEQGENTWFLLA